MEKKTNKQKQKKKTKKPCSFFKFSVLLHSIICGCLQIKIKALLSCKTTMPWAPWVITAYHCLSVQFKIDSEDNTRFTANSAKNIKKVSFLCVQS